MVFLMKEVTRACFVRVEYYAVIRGDRAKSKQHSLGLNAALADRKIDRIDALVNDRIN